MKTIANAIIINNQNVKSEHLLAVIITSAFKEESVHVCCILYLYVYKLQ